MPSASMLVRAKVPLFQNSLPLHKILAPALGDEALPGLCLLPVPVPPLASMLAIHLIRTMDFLDGIDLFLGLVRGSMIKVDERLLTIL
jgi:hypothetical protein